MNITLLTNASILDPAPRGTTDIVFDGHSIFKIGPVDQKALHQLDLEVEVVDAKESFVIPGIIDPHAHLLGGSGENGGFSSQTPEITLTELTQAGITTVVGTLGADTTMKTMPGLLACAKGLNEEGLNAFIYTGGYPIPPQTLLKNSREDIMFIQEVIGLGEVAISDHRSDEPKASALAQHVIDAHMGGMFSGKAGVTHFHVGPGQRRLQCLWDLLEYAPDIDPAWLYPTHIERSKELVKDAIRLSEKGSFVDMDVSEGELAKWLQVYLDFGGKLDRLTISSDASKNSPSNILREIRQCVESKKFHLKDLLPLMTRNPARALKLQMTGEIKVGHESSFVVLDKKTLEIVHVIAKRKFMIREGRILQREKFLQGSNRVLHLEGDKASSTA